MISAVSLPVLQQLSADALRVTSQLSGRTGAQLGTRLYLANRRPLTAALLHSFAGPQAIAQQLQNACGDAASALFRTWRERSPGPALNGWRIWGRTSGEPGPAPYKLYVSPDLAHTAEAFRILLEVLQDSQARNFKVAPTIEGLVRPDKLIVYFREHAHLTAVASDLAARLSGMPAQGVPFTGALSADGLLSWGVDPSAARRTAGKESWRALLTQELGAAMADLAGSDPPAAINAGRQRVRDLGVDEVTWTPASLPWPGPPAPRPDRPAP